MATNFTVHPGALLEEDLAGIGMTQKELSRQTGISTTVINELIKGKRSMNVNIAKKLEEVFGIPATFWMAAQAEFDLKSEQPDVYVTYGKNDDLTEAKYNANQIADRLLVYDSELIGTEGYEHNMTNLRLQKMLFFAQKEFIKNGKILFDDPIFHWQYGPVIKNVYRRFKGTNEPITEKVDDIPLSESDEKLLKSIFTKYNKYTTSYLVNLSHAEKVWKATNDNEKISPELIREYL